MFEEAGDLCTNLGKIFAGFRRRKRGRGKTTDLPCLCQRISIAEVTERHEGFVPLGEEKRRVSIVADDEEDEWVDRL